MTRRTFGVAMCVVALTLGGCGGGGSDDDATATTEAGGSVTSTTEKGPELPKFIGDFDRVCTTQVGFAGATAYEPTPGVLHPMVFFDEYRGESWVATGTFPQGWAVEQDTNFEDNSELAKVELIACSDRVKETPTGKQCEFEDDGKKTKLELVDSTYELTVYAATTGKVVKTATLEAKKADCPFIATFKEGDTKYVNEPSDDDYTAALKSVVAP